MVRKSISIGPDTWEALSALGKFGQSFDDVIQIILKEREECIRNHRQQQSQQQDGSVKKPQLSEILREKPGLEKKIHMMEFVPMIIRINLPGLEFPANKNEIIECAEKANQHQIISILKILPDKEYNSSADLEKERTLKASKLTVRRFFEEVNKNLDVKRQIGKIIVDTREIKQEQRKQLLQQQEQEFAQIPK